jgi:hypothetical protein
VVMAAAFCQAGRLRKVHRIGPRGVVTSFYV